MSESLSLDGVQNLIDSINQFTKSFSQLLNTSPGELDVDKLLADAGTGAEDVSKTIQNYVQTIQNQTQSVQSVTSNASSHRVYEYIHRYVYSRPQVKVGMPGFLAQDILYFVDQAMNQANAVLRILPQLTGSPLDFQRWANGLKTLVGMVQDFLPYVKEAEATVAAEEAEAGKFDSQTFGSTATSGRKFDSQTFPQGGSP